MNRKTYIALRHLPVCMLMVLLCTNSTLGKTNHETRKIKTAAVQSGTTFNLADFGAVGDGTTDDGPALQSALDAIAEAGGGTLFIPAGSYLVATPVRKDFSTLKTAIVNIQGVPSATMPAPVTAGGQELAAGLDLTSQIIPATGSAEVAITLTNLKQLTIEHVDFTGRQPEETDALITLYLTDIEEAVVRHCEFYGLSTFGYTDSGGGNVVRAVRSNLSIEQSVFLGCTANSGSYAPIIENIQWKGFSISNSILVDYGLRAFYGKMGYGAPLSWFNIGNAAAVTPDSPRREVIVRDVFLDEGGWMGITALPYRFYPPSAPIDLIYISGLKMNVSNFHTTGHLLYDAKNVLIENSHYGWSHLASSAVDIHRSDNVILDNLTCIANADKILVDDATDRVTVINSAYGELSSVSPDTNVMQTSPEDDPVQYVRQQFLATLGRQPDPAAHFYWSDLLIRCGNNTECRAQKRSELNEYLSGNPKPDFEIAGVAIDENGAPLTGATVNLTGSQSAVATTDGNGSFRFKRLPTTGSYTFSLSKRHYTFLPATQTITRAAGDVTLPFEARLDRHTIAGRITRVNGAGIGGIVVRLDQSPEITRTTDDNGNYSFTLPAGQDYTVTPVPTTGFAFVPLNATFSDLSSNRTANFTGWMRPEILTVEGSDLAVAVDSVNFTAQPFSLFNSLDFTNDGMLRLVIFGRRIESTATASQISLFAEDALGQLHPLEIEYLGVVGGQTFLKQINFKLRASSFERSCIKLKLTVANVSSNEARLCIANLISAPIPGN